MFIFLFLEQKLFFSGIAVEIRFLWDSKHGIYGAASFIAIVKSWYSHMDMRKFTSIILNMNFICIPQWLFEANFEILHCSGAFARRHKHFKPECYFKQTLVDYFLPRKYDAISQLRHSYAKDPLCVMQLKWWFKLHSLKITVTAVLIPLTKSVFTLVKILITVLVRIIDNAIEVEVASTSLIVSLSSNLQFVMQ